MRIIVLGIDALEYELVEEIRLSNIQQERYTKIDLQGFPLIVTSLIWSSMITGEIHEEIVNEFKRIDPRKFDNWIFDLIRKITPLRLRKLFLRKVWRKIEEERDEDEKGIQVVSSFLKENNYSTLLEWKEDEHCVRDDGWPHARGQGEGRGAVASPSIR